MFDERYSALEKVNVQFNLWLCFAVIFPRIVFWLGRIFKISAFWPLDSVRYFSDVIKHLVQTRKESNDVGITPIIGTITGDRTKNVRRYT